MPGKYWTKWSMMLKVSDVRKQGSITIFMVLCLTMVMSLFFTMSEVVRYFCMKSTAHTIVAGAASSGLGDYNRLLYEKYGILGVDLGYGRSTPDEKKLLSRMTSYASEGGSPKKDGGIITYVNLCRMFPGDAKLSDVTLLTDYGGEAFMKEAATQAVYDIPAELLQKWEEAGHAAESVGSTDYDTGGYTACALSGMDSMGMHISEPHIYVTGAKAGKRTISADESGDDESSRITEAVSVFKKRGVLYQVLGSDMVVSSGRITADQRVSKRPLNHGTAEKKTLSMSEKLMYKLYLLDRLGCYTDEKSRAHVKYELEYVVSGNLTDEENLRSVVKKLLALREAENLAALYSDTARRAEAEEMAAAASAALLNPELEPAIALAIMSAWAYVESVLDVRLLLSGGRVPLIKDPSNWTSELMTLPEYLNTDVKARDVSSGLDYKGYLFALLTITSEKKLGLRPMDLMEEELHQNLDYRNVRMDNMMMEATYHVTMSGSPLFLSMAPLVTPRVCNYEFREEMKLSYL